MRDDQKGITRDVNVLNYKQASGIKDFQDNEAMNSIIGESIVAERTDNVNVMFEYNISDYDTIALETGTGILDHNNAVASVKSGVGIGRAKLRSKEVVRYVTGHEVNAELTVDFANAEAGVTQKAGIGDDDDGMAAFGYDGIVFGIWLRTIDTGLIHIPQDQWNVDKADGTGRSGFDWDTMTESLVFIKYGWYGILPITFGLYAGKELGYIVLHIHDKINQTQNPHFGNPSLPLFVDVERLAGSGADIEIRTSSWRGGIVGKKAEGTLADRKFLVRTSKTILGVFIPVYSLRSNPTFQGRENHVRIRIGTVTISTDGTKAVEFDVFKGGTLTGGAWTPIDSENSVADYNNTATSYTPDSSPRGGTVLGKLDRDRINLISGDVIIPIYAGEEIHFVATTTNTNDVIVYFRHVEEF
jgi:hypothetical protein